MYLFQAPTYASLPCIAHPMLIRLDESDDSNEMALMFMLHELVHHNILFDEFYGALSDDAHEIAAYFVAAHVLRQILPDRADHIVAAFTEPWPYDFPRLVRQYADRIDLHGGNMKTILKTLQGCE